MRKKKNLLGGLFENKNLYWLIISILAIASATIIYAFTNRYAESFRTTFVTETKAYMLEIAQQVTLVMNDRVSVNMKNIETDTVALSKMKLENKEEIITFLAEETDRYGYSNLSIAGTDGIAVNNKGETTNVSMRKHFLSALRGNSSVSELITSDYNNTDSIEFAAAIEDDDAVIGVLIASYSLNAFRDILQVNMFDGKGSATVIDKQGVVIVCNGEQDLYNYKYTLKNSSTIGVDGLQAFSDDVENNRSGTFSCSIEEAQVMVYYQPLGINDWTLLITAPTDQITTKTNMFLEGTTNIGIIIAVLVTFLMLLIVVTQLRNRRVLEKLLYVDPITMGMSYAKFEIEAKKRIAENGNNHYAILQLNLEKFKLINTTFGRDAGNNTLCHINSVINADLNSDELVARVNADRFCMLLRYHSSEDITRRMIALYDKINEFNNEKTDKYYLHFSTGVCVADTDSMDIQMLYERANFSRTQSGKSKISQGQIAFYDEVERDIILREKDIENRMEEALTQNEFQVYLQPKYELLNDTIAGAEALVRWVDPQKGMLSPAEFIPLFERNGFIIKIDLYMFEKVCEFQQKRWENNSKCVPISVNLSRKHLEHLNFIEKYKDIFSRFTFPANLIEIELTESIVFDNMQQLCTVIDEIHKIGFECSMDDFGSGYSSLNMLKDIPVDTLKFDRAFFYSSSNDDSKSRFVIENMIDLAGKLNMKTVSEGIETLEQVEYLRRVKCGMIQGYVFAKPMPISKFEALFEKETQQLNI